MEISMELYGEVYKFQCGNGKPSLIFTQRSQDITRRQTTELSLPPNWVVARNNGVPLFALAPLPEEKLLRVLTAETLYKEKIQWFEPLADNYRKLIWVNPEAVVEGSSAAEAFKHFMWSDIIDFAVVDRSSALYGSYLTGDWKRRSLGGDGYLLVLVEGQPYWTDGVGQIPFAVDTFRFYLEQLRDVDAAILEAVRIGITYGDGNPFDPTEDLTNEYDNYRVLRGVLWATENFQFSRLKQTIEGSVSVRNYDVARTDFTFSSDAHLKNFAEPSDVDKYGIWLN